MPLTAVQLWNEPNNLEYWDHTLDSGWQTFMSMVAGAAQEIHAASPDMQVIMGGISPIDPAFVDLLHSHNVTKHIDGMAVHVFPYDWGDTWDLADVVARVRLTSSLAGHLPTWITEMSISSQQPYDRQRHGLHFTAERITKYVERVYWYSLFDVPRSWPVLSSKGPPEHEEPHYHMGLIDEQGSPKPAICAYRPSLGLCQWLHYQDHRLDELVSWLKRLGCSQLRTGISWADWHRPGGVEWYDQVMSKLSQFDVLATLCYTPPSIGVVEAISSPPRQPEAFAAWCREVVERYAP